MKSGGTENILREAVDTDLHPNNDKRKEDFSLSGSWKLLI
jgi:hypothetical protein